MKDYFTKWILDDNHQPMKLQGDSDASLIRWGEWFSDMDNRRVADDQTRYYRLSSVFLGIDHRFLGKGPPLLFETMLFERKSTVRLIFGRLRSYHEEALDALDGETCWRFATWDDTLANHNALLRRLQRQEEVATGLLAKHKLKTP